MSDINPKKQRFFTADVALPEHGVLVQSRQKRVDFADGLHCHHYLSLLYIVSGSGELEVESKKFELFPGSILTLRKGQMHRLIDAKRQKMTVFSLYFDSEAAGINKYIVDYLQSKSEPCVLPWYYSENTKKHLRQMLYEQNTRPPGYKLAIQNILNLTILQIYRARLTLNKNDDGLITKSGRQRVRSVLDFAIGNCHEQFSLSTAARMANVSQRQFSNLCKRECGKSFVQFLNSVRTARARELLNKGSMSVSAIAFEVGYEDLSTFYRAFKKHQGLSPVTFRK